MVDRTPKPLRSGPDAIRSQFHMAQVERVLKASSIALVANTAGLIIYLLATANRNASKWQVLWGCGSWLPLMAGCAPWGTFFGAAACAILIIKLLRPRGGSRSGEACRAPPKLINPEA